MRKNKKPRNFLKKCKISEEFRGDTNFEFGGKKWEKIYDSIHNA